MPRSDLSHSPRAESHGRPRAVRVVLSVCAAVLFVAAFTVAMVAVSRVAAYNGDFAPVGVQVFTVTDVGSRSRRRVEFTSEDGAYRYFHTYSRAEWDALPENADGYDASVGPHTTVLGHVFRTPDGTWAVFVPAHRDAGTPLPTEGEILSALRESRVRAALPLLLTASALLFATVAVTSANLVLYFKERRA